MVPCFEILRNYYYNPSFLPSNFEWLPIMSWNIHAPVNHISMMTSNVCYFVRAYVFIHFVWSSFIRSFMFVCISWNFEFKCVSDECVCVWVSNVLSTHFLPKRTIFHTFFSKIGHEKNKQMWMKSFKIFDYDGIYFEIEWMNIEYNMVSYTNVCTNMYIHEWTNGKTNVRSFVCVIFVVLCFSAINFVSFFSLTLTKITAIHQTKAKSIATIYCTKKQPTRYRTKCQRNFIWILLHTIFVYVFPSVWSF